MKNNIIIFLIVFFIVLFLLIMKTSPIVNLTDQGFHHSGLDSAVLYASYHAVNTEKIASPPSVLTSFLQKEDGRVSEYHCRPKDTAGFYKRCQSLPTVIMNLMKQKLIALYFYENLSVDGFLLTVYSSREQYYVMVCDQRILNKNLSEYLSNKENSRFIPGDYRITVHMTDTVFNALFYVLLHESFHIFDNENKISTPVDESGNYSSIKTPFITKYWRFPTVPQDSTFTSDYLIGNLYDKANKRFINNRYVLPIYTELSKGYFASYYSTASFQEDVAEYLTLYYMTQHLNSTYEIEVHEGDELLLSFRPFENRQLLDRLNDFPQNIH